jgi:hypothetical protein
MATISECLAPFIFFSSDFQCEMGLPYFFSMEGKYDAGPVTFFSATHLSFSRSPHHW